MGFQKRIMAVNLANSFLAIIIITMYAVVSFFSPGFDDEFFNIRWYMETVSIGGTFSDFIKIAGSDSAHPTGSYAISYFLYFLLNDWSLVRLTKAVLFSTVVMILILRIFDVNKRNFWIYALVVFISPSLLIWGTGLRWFPEFTILLVATVGLDRLIENRSRAFWPMFFLLSLLMINTNHMGILLFPFLLAYHAYHAKIFSNRNYMFFVLPGLIFIPIYLHDFIYLLQLSATGTQRGGILRSVLGVLQGTFINHGVFAFSFWGGISFLGAAGLAFITVIKNHDQAIKNRYLLISLALITAITVSGLGVKFRNITPVLPIFWGAIAYLFTSILTTARQWKATEHIAVAFFALLVVSNFIGLKNIILHENSSKGSWNLPVNHVIDAMREHSNVCDTLYVATWDPVITHASWQKGFTPIRIRENEADTAFVFNSNTACLAVVKTFGGSGRRKLFYEEARNLNGISAPPTATYKIKRDIYAQIKRKFDKDIPDFYVELDVYDSITAGTVLPGWTEYSLYGRPSKQSLISRHMQSLH